VTELSRDKLLALGNLLVVCLYDWVVVCLALMTRMQSHWPPIAASQDRYQRLIVLPAVTVIAWYR